MNEGWLYYFKTKTINKSGDEVELVKVGMTTDPDNRLGEYRRNDEAVKMVTVPKEFERLIAVSDVTLCEAWLLSKLNAERYEVGREYFILGDGSIASSINKLFDELAETKLLPQELQDSLLKERARKKKERHDRYYEEHPERKKAECKRYYDKNKNDEDFKAKNNERGKKYREKNPDKARESSRRYYDEHKDDESFMSARRESRRKYRETHKDDEGFMERERERSKRSRDKKKGDEEFRAKERERQRRYRKEHPDKVRESRKRYADKCKQHPTCPP